MKKLSALVFFFLSLSATAQNAASYYQGINSSGNELRSLWPSLHVGFSESWMPIIGFGMAIADRRRVAATDGTLRWSQSGF